MQALLALANALIFSTPIEIAEEKAVQDEAKVCLLVCVGFVFCVGRP
jgi:hypothetical protein